MILSKEPWGVKLFVRLNFLGILLFGLTLSAYKFGFGRLLVKIQNMSFASNMPRYDLLPPVIVRNVTHCTSGDPGNTACGRVTNVAFLKVHKAGSTTMQNLFFRFGLRHNLNILVPKKDNYLYHMSQTIPIKPPGVYNIFAVHSRYSKSLFDQLIPTGSVKIGIVREPVDRFVSAAYYYRDVLHTSYLKRIPQGEFIHNIVNYPEKYDPKQFSRTHNAMGFDFGFQPTIKSTDKKEIESYLNHLNSQFLLVLVAEKFDESLVIMKRYLSWSFHDIIYLKANSNKHKHVVLNVQEEAKVRETNFLDFALYEYFTNVFEEKLKSMRDDFLEEVEYFRHVLSELYAFCSQKELQNDSKLVVNQSVWENEFTVLANECKLMEMHALDFQNLIRRKVIAENNLL